MKPIKIEVDQVLLELDNPGAQVVDNLMGVLDNCRADFYAKVLRMLLGREPDFEKDKGRFTIHDYGENKTLLFDGKKVGIIKDNLHRMDIPDCQITFTPFKESNATASDTPKQTQ